VIANSLKTEGISFVESKHLLRVLGELNDIEIIRLARHLYRTHGSGEGYWETIRRFSSRWRLTCVLLGGRSTKRRCR